MLLSKKAFWKFAKKPFFFFRLPSNPSLIPQNVTKMPKEVMSQQLSFHLFHKKLQNWPNLDFIILFYVLTWNLWLSLHGDHLNIKIYYFHYMSKWYHFCNYVIWHKIYCLFVGPTLVYCSLKRNVNTFLPVVTLIFCFHSINIFTYVKIYYFY